MSGPSSVDGMLLEWGERVFNSSPVRMTKTRKGMTGLRLPRPVASASSPAGAGAQGVRKQLGTIVKRTPQVLVRISGGGKNIRHIKAHLDYISRRGQIPLEDQNGDRLSGNDEVDALRDEWQFGGFPIPEEGGPRQAFNIVLSMPAGTSELAVLRAARDFAAAEFNNFQYAMALHTIDTDPDPQPSPNPHVHLCVKATGFDGTRLNPRKGDLQRWREGFADCLREHGVEAAATRRLHRLQPFRGEKQSVRHKKARGESFDRLGRAASSADRAAKARAMHADVLTGYGHIARALAGSPDPQDRKLAVGLARRLAEPQQQVGRDREQQPDR